MTTDVHNRPVIGLDQPAETGWTPAGFQPTARLARRRAIVLLLNLATLAGLFWGLVQVFGANGFAVSDIIILVCFLVGAPWTVMGLWNAVIGLWLLHGVRDGLARTSPFTEIDRTVPISSRIALTMFLRNEPPERSLAKLAEMRRALEAEGVGEHFDVFVLSDTSDPEIAAAEEARFEMLRPQLGPRALYRRRPDNPGFKAGNVQDFLLQHGDGYDFFLPLDTDSLMGAGTIVEMVRMMEAHPRLGLLQSLVVGAPATSAFARIFQFGMRAGMRSFTMGAAWWHGDCGPYWGHNAIVRLAPFRQACRLPRLPGTPPLGGYILSHDQVEAALLRRAGYEVRVLPVETESWEENPPTLMDFTKRDLRWCQGNMQYWRILGWPGLRPMSRFQIFAAIMMYLGAPAWMLMTLAAASKLVIGGDSGVNVAFAIAMFFIMLAVSFVPKVAGWLDVMLTPGGTRRYGGTARFLAGGLTETLFSVLLAPVVALRVTLFLIGLLFGRSVTWNGQERDAYRLSWRDAARGLWPQTLFGLALAAAIFALAPSVWPWAAPVLAGMTFAIPFAVLTASPAVGRFVTRIGLCAIPEERGLPEPLARVAAAEASAPLPSPSATTRAA
ncbi:MAG: glucans biosynthesis glucosyltransferase MdoH [Pseudomonadota bacterium]